MTKLYSLLSVILILFNTPGFAHQDTILWIHDNGKISNLPEEYLPALFDTKNLSLSIKNNRLVFPECISKYFKDAENKKLIISASWYHEKQTMPYYIHFQITNQDNNSSYSLLLDLDTLQFISLTFADQNRHENILLKKQCLRSIKKHIQTIH